MSCTLTTICNKAIVTFADCNFAEEYSNLLLLRTVVLAQLVKCHLLN